MIRIFSRVLKKKITKQEFIIGIDENGDEIYKRCNSFEVGPNEFLTLVFFNREVMRIYFDNPQKYDVLDSYLPIDNNNRNYIMVFLGDLGKHLSYSEQAYWKGFNVSPDDKISNTYWNRSFMNTISPPEMHDLFFKHLFENFSQFWKEKFGWYLFKPLNEPDNLLFSTLHIPLSESPIEFEHHVLSLTKIIIDSINQKELRNRIKDPNKEQNGIDELEVFLDEKGINGYDIHIQYLRNLQK